MHLHVYVHRRPAWLTDRCPEILNLTQYDRCKDSMIGLP